MNVGLGGGLDFGGLTPIADLAQEATDMQVSWGGLAGLGIQDTEAGFGQGMNFGNKGDIQQVPDNPE